MAVRGKQLREEAGEIVVNRPLLAQANRIEALGEQTQWIVSLDTQIQKTKDDIRRLDTEIEQQIVTRQGKQRRAFRRELLGPQKAGGATAGSDRNPRWRETGSRSRPARVRSPQRQVHRQREEPKGGGSARRSADGRAASGRFASGFSSRRRLTSLPGGARSWSSKGRRCRSSPSCRCGSPRRSG